MSDLGDRALGSTITMQFSTAVNGVPTALAGSPVISVYGSNSSTPITSGVTLTGSYNSTTGLNNVTIVASAGNGFADGRDYSAVITTGTLSGISMVGYQIGTFSIGLGNVANLADQAITAAAGVTFPSSIASPTNITAGTITTATSVTNRVTANSDQIAGSAAAATNLSATTNAIGRGTATTGGSTTSIPTSAFTLEGSSATGIVSNQFVGRVVLFDGNTTTAGLRGAASVVSASTASNTPTLTVAALPASVASGDTFSLI